MEEASPVKARFMSNLLLAIDIGNTALSYGLFKNSWLTRSGYVRNGNIPKIAKLLETSGVNSSYDTIICSVVPSLTSKLAKLLKQKWGISPKIVGKNAFPVVKMKYKRSNLGADRLINVYGALKFYKLPILIIDFGTAITFDYVSKGGVLEGGAIVPGVETAWKALEEKAALLPKSLSIKGFKRLIGRNTKEAMWAGILQGYGSLTDGMAARFRSLFGPKMVILATGGMASFISGYCSLIDKVDPFHTLKSLCLLFNDLRKT